ncbi:global transactivator [Fusarium sporotrichioides]|uniref:Global transactivator n=1 Tax=Fusarium sporotrichioides TaxID=5514 RepID=A0A395STM1_FUSSP|nr:global transactivator [Fusarium sporotrichioides]
MAFQDTEEWAGQEDGDLEDTNHETDQDIYPNTDSEYSDSRHSASDQDSDPDEDKCDPLFDEKEFISYLEGLHEQIVAKWSAPPIGDIPNLRPNAELKEHQKHAVGKAEWAMRSQFKGMILGDPPGLGKTLSALSMIARLSSDGNGPSIILTPLSCCQHWMEEINKFFQDGTMPAVCLVDFKVIPKRPDVTLLSRVWVMEGVKPLGPLLILDEVHLIKNSRSRAFAATHELRQRVKTCIMMSGTPLDNPWVDAYALFSMLEGHETSTFGVYRFAFSGPPDQEKNEAPDSQHTKRLIQMMDAVTLRRPDSIVTDDLPPIARTLREYEGKSSSTTSSNLCFEELEELKKRHSQSEKGTYWGQLVKARQYAYHSMLVELHDIEAEAQLAAMKRDEAMEDVLGDQYRERIAKWHVEVKTGNNWRSERTLHLINLVQILIDMRPDDAMVIMDESVFFLDIVEISVTKALRHVRGGIPIFRYDGRLTPGERSAVITRFNAAKGRRLLLASLGAGGQYLNLQAANVLIRCGPWWNTLWEQRAEGSIYRYGQEKPTFVYELYDKNSKVDAYIKRRRDLMNQKNREIMEAVTHRDDRNKPEPRHME